MPAQAGSCQALGVSGIQRKSRCNGRLCQSCGRNRDQVPATARQSTFSVDWRAVILCGTVVAPRIAQRVAARGLDPFCRGGETGREGCWPPPHHPTPARLARGTLLRFVAIHEGRPDGHLRPFQNPQGLFAWMCFPRACMKAQRECAAKGSIGFDPGPGCSRVTGHDPSAQKKTPACGRCRIGRLSPRSQLLVSDLRRRFMTPSPARPMPSKARMPGSGTGI